VENTSQNPKDKEECGDKCTLNAGIGVALQICRTAGVPCDDIQQDVLDAKITVQEALDEIKKRLPSQFEVGLVEEVEKITKERLQELEEKSECVSVFVKMQMEKNIDKLVEGREKALETAPPNGKFAEGTKQLIQNLKESKKAIEDQPTCEAE